MRRKSREEEASDRQAMKAGKFWKLRHRIKAHPHGSVRVEYFERHEEARARQAELGSHFAELVDVRRPEPKTFPKSCPRCRIYIGRIRLPAGGSILCPHCGRRINEID